MPPPPVPRISVIMPTFNRAEILPRAIASVQAQSLQHWELIVIDDASTDATPARLEEIAASDPRIRIVHHLRNQYPCISRSLNEGLARARASLIARLDDDDYWCDVDKLRRQSEFLDRHPDYVLVGGTSAFLDGAEKPSIWRAVELQDDEFIRDRALYTNPFNHSAVMFRRQVACAAGGYGEEYQNSEDWDLWLKMGRQGKFVNLPGAVVYCSTHLRKTTRFRRAQARESLSIIRAHRGSYPNFGLAWAMHLADYVGTWMPSPLQPPLAALYHRAKGWVVPDNGPKPSVVD
jgi:glycosyltransferase involved in cell wall biosynthesis